MAGAARQAAVKLTTGLTGLPVAEHPHRTLKTLYVRIMKALEKMPDNAFYRQSTAQIIQDRLKLVESEPDVTKLEKKIGMGQIEEVILQATNELDLARNLADHKPWEKMAHKPDPGQWRWPI